LGASITEGIESSGSFSAAVDFYSSVLETTIGYDSFATSAIYSVVVSEASTAFDSFAGRPLWELIADSQDANWQNVATAAPPAWTLISAVPSVLPDWQLIET